MHEDEDYDAAAFIMPCTPTDPPLPSDDVEPEYLRELHPVPWFDDHVRMHRGRHVYVLDGVDLPISTTGHMKQFVGEFDAEAKSKQILERLRTYERNKAAGFQREPADWLVRQYERYKHCQTAEEIRHEWNIVRDAGTFAHRLIELYYNRMLEGPLTTHSALRTREFQQFLRFDATHVQAQGYLPFRTEFTMQRYEIGGQIDMLYQHRDDAADPARRHLLWMVDWKRKFELGDHGDALKAPFANMPPGDRTKFTIQLNTYKAMIEALTPYRITRMTVLLVHPEMNDYYMEELVDIQPQIAIMFEERRLALIERKCQIAGDIALLQARNVKDTSGARGTALHEARRLIEQAIALTSVPPPPKFEIMPTIVGNDDATEWDDFML